MINSEASDSLRVTWVALRLVSQSFCKACHGTASCSSCWWLQLSLHTLMWRCQNSTDRDQQILLYFFPSHTSHITQPLDVGFFLVPWRLHGERHAVRNMSSQQTCHQRNKACTGHHCHFQAMPSLHTRKLVLWTSRSTGCCWEYTEARNPAAVYHKVWREVRHWDRRALCSMV